MTRPSRDGLVREWAHLIARFFDVLRSTPLTPAEQVEVDRLLDTDGERRAYWAQPIADQRHGLSSARSVVRVAPDRRDLARAALLHDIGKRHAKAGVVARSLAGAARSIGATPSGRIGHYLDHGPVAAAELAEEDACDLVVEFARHHHGDRPDAISERDWTILQAADRVR